jgi:hypothetical protein
MAEQANATELVPVNGEYVLSVRDFDAAGKATSLSVALPESPDFNKWSLMQTVIMLKKGAWAGQPVADIVYAIAYAHNKGLDIFSGDIYSTGQGKINTSNKAKIKLALATGNIVGIEVSIVETADPIAIPGCTLKKDLECTATIHVKGWTVPIVRKSRLSKWFNAKNPNWQGRPEHMLELNTVAHAVEYVNPTVTDDSEAPPLNARD